MKSNVNLNLILLLSIRKVFIPKYENFSSSCALRGPIRLRKHEFRMSGHQDVSFFSQCSIIEDFWHIYIIDIH